MRHVFPTSEVIHRWAHQTQDDARNAAGNVYFKGATLYSYRDSWPMGRIYEHAKRGKLVLLNSERASVTTAKHQGWADRAVSHLPSVAVPSLIQWPTELPDHACNLDYFAREIAQHADKASRAMQVRTVNWRTSAAQALHLDRIRYAEFFGIRRKFAFPAAEFEKARERAQRIETPDPIRDAAKIRARERKAERERAALQGVYDAYCAQVTAYNAAVLAARAHLAPFDPVQRWRDTGTWQKQDAVELAPEIVTPCIYAAGLGYRDSSKLRRRVSTLFDMPRVEYNGGYFHYDGPVLLRIAGAEIVSSLGARIPLDHAPRIWRLVQACRATGRAYERNGHTEHAGPYAIDAVTAQGELKAGCHTIPYAELELMARRLGLEVS